MRNRAGILYAAVLAFALLLGSQASRAFVTVGVSITIAPPVLPVYEQPPIPAPGYLWTPGYWAWADDGYYWVPGTWVEAPEPGLLWTPGYWGWVDGLYFWHEGYWGPHVGFYGGVNYGFGYLGHGYEGGYWDRGAFRYNRAYNNIHEDVHITNVYNKTVIVNQNHVSFNGGNGGIQARPGPEELAAEHDHHVTPLSAQLHHEEGARGNPELRASYNHGRPPIGATAHAGVFSGQGVVPVHGAGASVPHPTGVSPPHPANVTPHPAFGVSPPHPANVTPHPAFGASNPPPVGVTPPHSGGAGVPNRGAVPAIRYQHGGASGGPAPGGPAPGGPAPGGPAPGGPATGGAATGGHPGGGGSPPPHEHDAHDRPEGR
ncbi:MAG: YXWGXW repeat-containing protein [Steroidobacterales bacterium]